MKTKYTVNYVNSNTGEQPDKYIFKEIPEREYKIKRICPDCYPEYRNTRYRIENNGNDWCFDLFGARFHVDFSDFEVLRAFFQHYEKNAHRLEQIMWEEK